MKFPDLHRRLDRALMRIEDLAALAAGIILIGIMVLVSADAILRHAFAAPLTFAFHLTQNYLLVSCVMLALPWGYRRGGAIQVLILLGHLPRAFADGIVRAGLLGGAVYVFALAASSWRVFYQAHVNQQVVMGVIDWPTDWSLIWVPLGCFLLACRLVLDASAPRLRAIGGAFE